MTRARRVLPGWPAILGSLALEVLMLALVLGAAVVWYSQLAVASAATSAAAIAVVVSVLIGGDPPPAPDPPPSWLEAVEAPVDAEFSRGGR